VRFIAEALYYVIPVGGGCSPPHSLFINTNSEVDMTKEQVSQLNRKRVHLGKHLNRNRKDKDAYRKLQRVEISLRRARMLNAGVRV
jgi:ribosomal protein S15P/S13E